MNLWHKLKHIFYIKNNFDRVILVFVLVCIYLLGLFWVAPEYDEVLVANAALNCSSNVFIEKVFWINGQCLPVMLSSYLGGVLALPYKFLFLFLPAGITSFRLFNVALLFIALFLLYRATTVLFSKKIALYTLILFGFDFQVWYNIRFERTATVPLLLKMITYFFLSQYVQDRKLRHLFGIGLCMGLSFWAKFDAVFFYVTLLVAFVIAYPKIFRKSHHYLYQLLCFFSGLFLGMGPLLWYLTDSFRRFVYIGIQVGSSSLLESLPVKAKLLFYQFASYDAIWYIFRQPYTHQLLLILALLGIWSVLCLAVLSQRKHAVFFGMSIALFFFYGLYLVFGGLRFSHHRFLVYPLPHLILAAFLVQLQDIKKWLFVVVWIGVCIWSVATTLWLANTLPVPGAATSQIYGLEKYLSTNAASVVVGDWGIANQLLLLSGGSLQITEVAFAANTISIDDVDVQTSNVLATCDHVVLHTNDAVIFENADTHLRSMLDAKLVYTDGIFEVYRCN